MKKKTIISFIKITFVLVVIAIIGMVLSKSWTDIAKELRDMTWKTFVLLVICSVFFNIFEGMCYYVMGKKYNDQMRVVDGIGCSYYCAFFKLSTLGSGTAAAGMFYLNRKGVQVQKSFGMITINYMMQKVAIGCLCVTCFVLNYHNVRLLYSKYFTYLILGIIATVFVAIGLLMVILWKPLHSLIIFLSNRLARTDTLKELVGKLEEKIIEIRTESREIVKDKKFLSKIFLYNVVKYFGWYMIPNVLLGVSDAKGLFLGFTICSLAMALVGVIPSPGALGSTEALFYAMFLVISSKPEAITIMLLYRCFTYICPFAIGAIFILIRKLVK